MTKASMSVPRKYSVLASDPKVTQKLNFSVGYATLLLIQDFYYETYVRISSDP